MFRSRRGMAAGCAAALAVAFAAPAAAAACPNASVVVVEPKASLLTRPVKDGPHRTLFVRREPITTTADITDISLASDAYDTAILLKFTPDAARRLNEATTNRSGLRIAFVVDDEAISAVTWTGPYGMDVDLGVQLSLGRPAPRLRPLVEAIRRCLGPDAR